MLSEVYFSSGSGIQKGFRKIETLPDKFIKFKIWKERVKGISNEDFD